MQISVRTVRLRRTRPCHWCSEAIENREFARRTAVRTDGSVRALYEHPECAKASTDWWIDAYKQDLDESIHPHNDERGYPVRGGWTAVS